MPARGCASIDLLEAPIVQVLGDGSALAANGGGGGCFNESTPAEDGRLDDQRASGCESAGGHGAGGLGGAGSAAQGTTGGSGAGSGCTADNPAVSHGGGGGGGAGRIRINTETGSFSPQGGALVSPTPTTGEIAIP